MATTLQDDPSKLQTATTAAPTGLLGSTAKPVAAAAPSATTTAPKDYTADLQNLYKTTLGRAADKGGLDFYTKNLQSGAITLDDVQADLAKSQENQQRIVKSNTTPVPQAEAATAKTYSYDPTMQKTSAESLVQNQLASITATGSKLNELAEAKANQQANRRGLLNSSLAVEGAQKAVLESSLPVAQQDAATFAGADTANAQFSNAANQFNTGAKNTAALQDANLQTQVSIQNASNALAQRIAEIQANTSLSVADKQAASQKALSDADNATKIKLQQIDGTLKQGLAQTEADNRQLLQTNISAANAYAQYAQALAQISTSKDMDAGAKQQAADNQLQALQATLRAIGQVSGLDLSKYFQSATQTNNQTGGTGGGAGSPSAIADGIGGLLNQVAGTGI